MLRRQPGRPVARSAASDKASRRSAILRPTFRSGQCQISRFAGSTMPPVKKQWRLGRDQVHR